LLRYLEFLPKGHLMNDREQLDQWADALLEQHRSPGARRASGESGDFDAYLADRLEARQRLHEMLAKGEAIVTLIGIVLLFAFGVAFYESF
jgi:hypothetical protein